MNYESKGKLTVIYGDGTQQELGDAELKIEGGVARICQNRAQPRKSWRGEALAFEIPLSTRVSNALVNWPALSLLQQLNAVTVQARLLGMPEELVEAAFREEYERARSGPDSADPVGAIQRRMREWNEQALTEARALETMGRKITARRKTTWKSRHYGPQRLRAKRTCPVR